MTILAQEIENKVNNSFEMFILAARECGFNSPDQIEENFDLIALVAAEMVKASKDRVITKLVSNPNWIKFLAARYQRRVLNQ